MAGQATIQGRTDARLRVIFDNGTESNLLMRSLQRALNERGIVLALAGRKRQTEYIAAKNNMLNELQQNFLVFSSLKQAYRAFRQRERTEKTETADQLPAALLPADN